MEDSQVYILLILFICIAPILLGIVVESMKSIYVKSCKRLMLKWRKEFRIRCEKREEIIFKKALGEVR